MKKDKKKEEVEEYEGGNKGVAMLRLDRKLAPILDAWREAKKRNPGEWK